MQTLGRFLQLIGLTAPPLSIVAELGHLINGSQMLLSLAVSAVIFTLGYFLQRAAKRN
jgi:hypothetical protein